MKWPLISLSLLLATGLHAQGYENIVRTSLRKVVTIEISGRNLEGEKVGYIGSGAFITSDGMVLTCGHVLEHELRDLTVTVKTEQGKRYKALLLAKDHSRDLGLLKVFGLRPFPYFELGGKLAKGQVVIALGTPLEIENTASVGYVENLGVSPRKFVLHSAFINPGNSGGPLMSVDGKLVGVNVSILMLNAVQHAGGLYQAVCLKDIRTFLDY